MDIIEYAVGIGGWITVICLTVYALKGADFRIHPLIVLFSPCLSILFVYSILRLVQSIFYVFITLLYYMFKPEIITIIVGILASGAFLFTIVSTYDLLKENIAIVEHVD
jgi:hypothetical protein